jgi:surface protein
MTNKKYIFNNNNFNENNAYICYKLKMIYQKIYKLSRYYLDVLSENQICFKYSSLLLSAFIIKKSIEFILPQEKFYNNKNIDKALKERFIIKTNNYYKQMMKKYYDLDYEIIPEYQKLINDYDLNKLFYQNNKGFNMIYHNIKPNKAINISNKKGNYLYNNNIKKDKNNKINDTKSKSSNELKINFEIDSSRIVFALIGEKFISENNDKCKVIINGKDCFQLKQLKWFNAIDDGFISVDSASSGELPFEIIIKETQTITNMDNMINGIYCYKMSIDFQKWNISNVTSMENLFNKCEVIKGISEWDVSNVKDMSGMFSGCNNIPDISKWDVSNVKDMNHLFSGCNNIPDISE